MADVRPFRALRYAAAAGPLSNLVSPPYDVISPEERRAYLAASPYNAVRLILPDVTRHIQEGQVSSGAFLGLLSLAVGVLNAASMTY